MQLHGSFVMDDTSTGPGYAVEGIALDFLSSPFGLLGIRPRGYDEYSNLYQNFCVRSVRYKLSVMPIGDALASGVAVMGSYLSMDAAGNAPLSIRDCIEVPNTTGRSWDLGYTCGSNTVVTAAQVAPYEREGYVEVSKLRALNSYGINDYFPDSSGAVLWLVVFAGLPDDTFATNIMDHQVTCQLTYYVEWFNPQEIPASNV